MVELFTGDVIQPTTAGGIGWTVAYVIWFGLYLWVSFEIAGKTPGKALVGLRVVGLDGLPLGPGRALVRTVVFPFSFILGLGFIPAVTRKDRRALHELAAGSKEIVDWGDRDAGIPSALEGWVSRQRDAQQAAIAGAPVPASVAAAAGLTPATEVIEVELQVTPSEDGSEAPIEADEPVAAMVTPVLTEPVHPDDLIADADPVPEPVADVTDDADIDAVTDPTAGDPADGDYWAAFS